MDNKDLQDYLTKAIDVDAVQLENLVNSFADVIKEALLAGDSPAFPSFGTFTPVKHDEEIRKDLSSGKVMMYPPQISIEFNPAASLRKK